MSERKYDFDITVIGGGPGGYVAAIAAAKKGKNVCIAEHRHFGGVCLNEGCIPTKTLIHTADLFDEIKKSDVFAVEGVDKSAAAISMEKLQKRKSAVVNQLVSGVKGLLKGNKVTVKNGFASFETEHSISIGGETVTSEYFIIATGSETTIPSFIEQKGANNIVTSRELLNITAVPESLAVIGGGVIGIEFAYLLNKLGCRVTVIELLEQILPMADKEIAGLAQSRLEKEGIAFKMGAKVKRIQDNTVYYEYEGGEQTLKAEMTLLAVGRRPYTEGLGAETIGVKFDKAAIITDEYMRTNISSIYAIGDVNAKCMLAHTASHEGIVAVNNICGGAEKIDYGKIPSCIYIKPEIACIGMSEQQAREKYSNIKIGKFPMSANGKSLIEDSTDGLIKVIVDGEFGEILGAHLYCSRATDMIAELSLAMSMEATADEVIAAIHPHPTISEAVPEAFMAAYSQAIHSLR